ncbi:MAG: hypothetical protein ACOYZ7_06435 [Chloroflexota bacterium]
MHQSRFVSLLRHLNRDLLSILLLLSAGAALFVLATTPIGAAALETLFQSPANTPTSPPPTATLAPTATSPAATPTNSPVPPAATPTETIASATPTEAPVTATPTEATVTATPLPPTVAPIDTPSPTAGFVRMPLLPSTATPQGRLPTPNLTSTEGSTAATDFVGWIVVGVILVLAAVAGLYIGNALRNRTQAS